jgi:hypothetical protein
MLEYSFSSYWSFFAPERGFCKEKRGHRLVSATNRGGEGVDTIGAQKNDCREVGMDFPTVVIS